MMESLQVNFLSIYSKYCDYKTPYYESTTDACYSTCPEQTQNQEKLLSCVCYENNKTVSNDYCLSKNQNLSNEL